MLGAMEKLFENKELNVSVRTVRRGEEVLYYTKDVAETLGYATRKKPSETMSGNKTKQRWGSP
jgi:prophage antirepressor-like protein